MEQLHNTERNGLWIGLVIALAGLVLIALPSLLSWDMMNVGYGISCLGSFVVVMGLAAALVFGLRARTMDQLLNGQEVLARWSYDPQQSRRQIESAARRAEGQNFSLYLIMVFWFVVIGGGFVVMDYLQEGSLNWAFIRLMFGIMLLLGVVAYAAPRLMRRQALAAGREVIIGRRGMILNGALHTWSGPFDRLAGVDFNTSPDPGADTEGPALIFTIRSLSRVGWIGYRSHTVHVPVPPGQQEAAARVLHVLQGRG